MQMRILPLAVLAMGMACAALARSQVIDEAAVEKALEEREAARRGRAAARDAAHAKQQEMLQARAQDVQLMQPLMWQELDFIRLTCDLTPEQRPSIKAAAENGVNRAAREIVQPQRSAEGRTVAFALQTIRSHLAKTLLETLTPEQQRRYKIQTDQRLAARRQASIACAIARLDDVLLFTSEQCACVAQALEKNWQDDREQWPNLWRYAVQYCPAISDEVITPCLDTEQKAVWNGLQKISVNRWSGQPARDASDDSWWEGKSAAITGRKLAGDGGNK
jgi:hypothetical protein